jgi:hypothetical protein
VPDGVRLVLQLPRASAISGRLVRDWVRPTRRRGQAMTQAARSAARPAAGACSPSRWWRPSPPRRCGSNGAASKWRRPKRSRVQSAWVLTGALDWARLILREDARSGGADHLGEPWAVPLQEARLSTFLAADRNNTAPTRKARSASSRARSSTCSRC